MERTPFYVVGLVSFFFFFSLRVRAALPLLRLALEAMMLLKNAGDVVEKKGWVRRRGPALSR